MTKVIRIHELAVTGAGQSSNHDGRYLETFDPDGNQGRGRITSTPDLAAALQFDTAEQAMEMWRKQSTAHPLRQDGHPNRPLTAYSCEIIDLALARMEETP
jgi:hypothetical protein